MAYEDLLKSVEESAHEKELELRNREAAAVDEIKARAKKQAGAIRQAHLDGAGRSITTERNKLLYLTKAENKELLIKTRETAFERAFAESEARLDALRSEPDYPAVFENLIKEATGSPKQPYFLKWFNPANCADESLRSVEALAPEALFRYRTAARRHQLSTEIANDPD